MTRSASNQCVCTAVRKADRAVFRFYESALSPTGVSLTQFSILRQLQKMGPTPLSRLAEALVMERTSLYRTIRPLEARHALLIEGNKQRKVRIATLTPEGEKLIEAVTPVWARAQTQIIRQLGKDTWAALSTTLNTLTTLVTEES